MGVLLLTLALALGAGLLGSYELYTFINFPYHGMFLMLILLFGSVDSRPRPEMLLLATLLFAVLATRRIASAS